MFLISSCIFVFEYAIEQIMRCSFQEFNLVLLSGVLEKDQVPMKFPGLFF